MRFKIYIDFLIEIRIIISIRPLYTCSSTRCPLFYTRSHLSAPQSCVLISQPIFSLFSHLHSTRHNFVVEVGRVFKTLKKNEYLVNLRTGLWLLIC